MDDMQSIFIPDEDVMRIIALLILTIFFMFSNGYCDTPAMGPITSQEDFSPLLTYIAMEDLQEPLVSFEQFEGDFDRGLNQENLAHLNQDKALLQKIKSRLKGDTLRWKLASSLKQRFVVPEKRPQYATLFEQYCRQSVDYLLARLEVSSPYAQILTIGDAMPNQWQEGNAADGIKVFLTHNVIDEYIEEYEFFSSDDDASPNSEGSKIKIKIRNRAFAGQIGSYTSDLVIGEDSHFEFVHNAFTLWQNSAKNPLNVFIVPIEETLHILLRSSTETAISDQLKQIKPQKIEQVESVIDHWMAVEEAIVGGLVAQLMPEIFSRFLPETKQDALTQALEQRLDKSQYRYLNNGIHAVANMGLDQAVKLYRSDPKRFNKLVTPPELAGTTLGHS